LLDKLKIQNMVHRNLLGNFIVKSMKLKKMSRNKLVKPFKRLKARLIKPNKISKMSQQM